MNAFKIKLAVAGVLALLGFALLRCALWADYFKFCARSVFIDTGLHGLHFTALGIGIWAGVELHNQFKIKWLSWLIGIAVFLCLSLGLSALGFEYPSSDSEFEEDNNYRR
jgi:hypothetical protein